MGPIYVHDSFVDWSVCEARSSRTRICPWCMSCLFGTYSLWCDALPSLDVGERSLVLPQLALLTPMRGVTLFEWA